MIVGLGGTGLSYARYLAARAEKFQVLDDHPMDRNLSALREIDGEAEVRAITHEDLIEAEEIFVSPGVPLAKPELAAARKRGARLRGDIEIFGELASAPIVAITGTNGKSTVSQLVTLMVQAQQIDVVLAGNIGTPCLDVLFNDPQLYVLELSSYQLELALSFPAKVAVVLNLSPDHMDRYVDVDTYYNTKLNLYQHCETAVVNRSLMSSLPAMPDKRVASFGLDQVNGEGQFGLARIDGAVSLMHGDEVLMACNELQISGTHNFVNVLAALATGWLLGLAMPQMLATAKAFTGLPHRNELINEIDGVKYINDSKATNPGAMLASVMGQADECNVHLIAGGETKGLEFESSANQLAPYLKSVLLIGESQEQLKRAFSGKDTAPYGPVSYGSLSYETVSCADMHQAVLAAHAKAEPGDIVLLSPGCASFDQFADYIARGNEFRRCVLELVS